MNPAEVALALKLAHLKANWGVVEAVIEQIERLYGEIPLSTVLVPAGTELHPRADASTGCDCLFCTAVRTLESAENELDTLPSDTVLFRPWHGITAES